jgi:hypothetical protein
MVAGRTPHQSASGIQPRTGRGMGLWRAASRGWQVADLHLPPTKLKGLHIAAGEDRASYPERAYLPDCRQPQNAQERFGQRVTGEASENRTRVHPKECGVVEPHRSMVASFSQAGACRTRLRRRLRNRSSNEGRHPAIRPESQSLGVGPPSHTAEVSEAHFCVPSLRNGALAVVC